MDGILPVFVAARRYANKQSRRTTWDFFHIFSAKSRRFSRRYWFQFCHRRRRREFYAGILPNLQADKLILNSGETCHFVDVAAIITEKKHYESRHDGASFRVFKGFTYHTGDTKSVPVVEPEYTKGILYFTGRRIIFVARKFGFDQKISKLTAVTPYTNGMELQFGNKTFTLLLPDGTIAKAALDLIL